VLVLVLLGTAAIWARGNSKSTLQYRTQEVLSGNLTVTVTATGNLAPTNTVEVGSELSGIVKTVRVDYNDKVAVGQPLADLDNTRYEAAVMQTRSGLASAVARLEQARATLNQKEQIHRRLQKAHELSGGRAPSAGELELALADALRARADEKVALAAIEQARAALKIDETNLSKTTIYSPVDGIVLTRNVEPGQTVAASLQAPVLFTLAEDLSQMRLQVNVDEADVGRVKLGQPASFTVSAFPSRRFPAKITRVAYGSTITDNVVTYQTLLDVKNEDLSLRPGMTATSTITAVERKNVLLVPNTALRFTPQSSAAPQSNGGIMSSVLPRMPRSGARKTATGGSAKQVWVLRDGAPVAVSVSPGISDGRMTEITGGDLVEGVAVITDQRAGAAGKP